MGRERGHADVRAGRQHFGDRVGIAEERDLRVAFRRDDQRQHCRVPERRAR